MNNLIITQSLLQTFNACQEAQDYMTEKNLWGQTEDVVLANMAQDGKTNYIQWWDSIIQTPLFVKTIGAYSVTGYKVQNPITNQYQEFSIFNDAEAQLVANKQAFVIHNKDRFSVNRDIDNPDGTVTWIPVDPFTFDQEDDYQVFNTFTGQYTFCPNLAEAKVLEKSMEDQFASQVPLIQQQITSNDYPYSAWESI